MEAKHILTKVTFDPNGWFGIDYNVNLYRGCNHGCIYCDSRSDCYHIDDFDTVRVKHNALSLLEQELSHKKRKGIVGIGSMSDSYNPFEKELEVTRGALSLFEKYGFGVSIDTKSDLIVRDIDLLKKINDRSGAIIKLTITCADDDLSKLLEPHVVKSSRRFSAVKALSDADIFVGVLCTPILPFINDSEENIRKMVKLSKDNGAKFIYCNFGVTLRSNQRDYYYQKLDQLYPGLKERYQKYYQERYWCPSLNEQRLWKIFQEECEKQQLLYRMEDIIYAYKKKEKEQISLFEVKNEKIDN